MCELDLDALERDLAWQREPSATWLRHKLIELIVELRACRAERALAIAWHNDWVRRAERAEARIAAALEIARDQWSAHPIITALTGGDGVSQRE